MQYTPKKSTKGMINCYQCRKSCSKNEGGWVQFQNQQVWLCDGCEKKQKEAGSEAFAKNRREL